jgi:thioesterase domain-containing protein
MDSVVASSRSPLIALRDGGDAAPFFCVHPSGGSVFCYLELARRLGPERPFYGLEAAGLQGEALPLQRVEDMAERYLGAVVDVQPSGPYRLGGWSIGGMVAFEMARRLESAGLQAALLAVLDSAAPAPAPAPTLDELLGRFVRDLASQVGAPSPTLGDLTPLPTAAKVTEVGQRLREAALISSEVGPRQLRARLAVFVANVRAAYAYAPGAYGGQVTLFRADASPPGDMAWDAFARGGMTTHVLPGNHNNLLDAPNVDRLAAALGTCLAAVDQ